MFHRLVGIKNGADSLWAPCLLFIKIAASGRALMGSWINETPARSIIDLRPVQGSVKGFDRDDGPMVFPKTLFIASLPRER